jgi:hypothetical protein
MGQSGKKVIEWQSISGLCEAIKLSFRKEIKVGLSSPWIKYAK